MSLNNTLLPPEVNSYLSPFVYGGDNFLKIGGQIINGYKIGFKINSPKGIEIYRDSDSGDAGLLEIKNNKVSLSQIENIIGNRYIRNQYYRIQLRFRNGSAYSDWSSTVFIRFISNPQLKIYTSPEGLYGQFYFNDEKEKEVFQEYKVIIENYSSTNTILLKREAENWFEYVFPEEIYTSYAYQVRYKTASGYTGVFEGFYAPTASTFSRMAEPVAATDINITATVNDAGVRVIIHNNGGESKTVTLARNSEIIKENISIPSRGQETFIDNTVENGGAYTYSTTEGGNSKVQYANLDSAFLIDGAKHFPLMFNEDVSGLKYVVSESITNTIGSKYPFVRRNANTKYRQFTLGGLISKRVKECINIDSLTAELTNTWDNPEKAEILGEKEFRTIVEEFLTNGEPKLFKSATEGNILITLTNVSFTPNKQLGRKIYSFSATATEIDECSIANYKKYNILEKTSAKASPAQNFTLYHSEGDYETISSKSFDENEGIVYLVEE